MKSKITKIVNKLDIITLRPRLVRKIKIMEKKNQSFLVFEMQKKKIMVEENRGSLLKLNSFLY